MNLFNEYIRIERFAPLNFLSGGLGGDPLVPLSSASAHADVLLVGVNVAF
ncbi:MAG: hypothetical protein WBN40_08190 [Pseudomonadales bacterium]